MISDIVAITAIAIVWLAAVAWTAYTIGYQRGERARIEEESWLDGMGGDADAADVTRPDLMPSMPPTEPTSPVSVPAWPANTSRWDGLMPEGEQLIPYLAQDMAQLKLDMSQEFDRIIDEVWRGAPPAEIPPRLRVVE